MSKVAPRVLFNYDAEAEEEEELDYGDEGGMTFNEEEEEIQMVVEEVKEVIKQEIIFDDPNKPPPKLTKSGKPRKPMSAEHKEKLKFAREKAVISRRKKQVEREEERKFQNEEKELLKKKKIKDFEKLKIEVEEPVEETIKNEKNKKIVPIPQQQQTFTKEDLENASLDAIIKYETIRKDRKKKKQEEQMIINQREEIKNKLQGNPRRPFNPYANCY